LGRSTSNLEYLRQKACFSPDGRLLAVIEAGHSETRIRVLETATGQVVELLAFPGGSGPLAFSPDGRYLVGPHSIDHWHRRGLQVCDLVLGRELGDIPCHRGDIDALAFSPDGRKLATGSTDRTALIWDATWPTLPRPSLPEAQPIAPEDLWRDLSRPEAERAWRAVWRLALTPEQALPLLQRELRPAAPLDAVKLARLLPELERDEFARREVARKEILTLGEGAIPALRRRLEANRSADLRRLLEGLLEDLEPRPNAPQRLLDSRAFAVLERAGAPEALQWLRRLAQGAEEHSRTEMAREALRRLER
jgi:hypothetical protein